MRGTALHWVDGPWKGRLALAARPRGGDWLAGEMEAWRQAGVGTVVSFLEPAEERDLELEAEGAEARAHGMHFCSVPIADRAVPVSRSQFVTSVDEVEQELAAGRNVVLHCRQGVGRTGMMAACLMLLHGGELGVVLEVLSKARGVSVPETAEQRAWLERFAESLTVTR